MHRRAPPSSTLSQREDALHQGTFKPVYRPPSSSSKSRAAYLLIILALVGLLVYQDQASKRELNDVLNEEKQQIDKLKSEIELQKSIFEEERKQIKNEFEHGQKKDSATGDVDQSEFFRKQVDHLREEMQKSAKINTIEK